ncbi:dNTP triphosphohydrolase [Pseudomonas sp. RAC1]|uniref:dGTP triphosphohydrolase n=1 Tax=Pseudomonas sp. RAC1 TaxID=3064900 RepID=UPI0027156B49|nr:dNTP triphosphohydrolase [Pseudomonas sp. RAC1]MDV9032704.1 dNTP triphosphohydrolase [Pseudomonas sp. RAC1]
MFDRDAIDYAKAQEIKIAPLEYRVFEHKDGRTVGRKELMRDYARILYSSSFRRLQGKMQLLGIDAGRFNRNRLTHSLEVAQIARSIASDLELNETVVAEAAALAHDIGNPPFGHHGETVLNELCHGCGGYEGNAQAFRILRTLERKHHLYDGLNLNVRTLMGVTKYFHTRQQNPRKFLYDDDYAFLNNALSEREVDVKKSIDAEIMDLADEIAYAAHDLEDALSFGLISLGEIIHEFHISAEFSAAHATIENLCRDVERDAMKAKRSGSSEEYTMVLKKELTSKIVNTLCADIGLVEGSDGPRLGYKSHAKLAEGLKKLLFKAILRKKDVQLYEKRGERVIRGLFEVYSDESYNRDNRLLPPELRSVSACKSRLVTDYIAGMMDLYSIQEYERYFGKGSLDGYYFAEPRR